MTQNISRPAPRKTTRYQSMITPTDIPNKPSASRSGYNEGNGMWILLISTSPGELYAGVTSIPCASTLPYFITQKASREVTVGIVAKL